MSSAARPDVASRPELGGLHYQSGFGNYFATEALPGALPAHNSPQRCAYGLCAEQISGTAFTAPRAANRRTWLYRIRPAAMHGTFRRVEIGRLVSRFEALETPPDQLRWNPLPIPSVPTDFLEGLVTMAGKVIRTWRAAAAFTSMRPIALNEHSSELADQGQTTLPRHDQQLPVRIVKCASSWGSFTAPTTPEATAFFPAARPCTTA